jgi:tetraacyldisaccharide 4'-kinase
MEQWLTRVWYEKASGGALLLPLTVLYSTINSARRRAYDAGLMHTHRVAKPVIVVGNLTVGGTGKTPLVVWLAQRLKAQGLKVAIVSRGYGSRGGTPREVAVETDWREVGDEPVLLSRRSGCRVFVSPDRVAAARAAVQSAADVIVADDGLQHLRLERDCELVVIDGARGLGNGRLLPAGPLREGAERLSRVDLVVINGEADAALQSRVMEATGNAPLTMHLASGAVQPVAMVARAQADVARPLADFRGKQVHAVAGIGNPARFFQMLRGSGVAVIEHPFSDHHPLTPSELEFEDDLPILMTEKDAVRCAKFANSRMYFVPVTAELSEPDAARLMARIDRAVHASPAAKR